jgi:hypothetical protein
MYNNYVKFVIVHIYFISKNLFIQLLTLLYYETGSYCMRSVLGGAVNKTDTMEPL